MELAVLTSAWIAFLATVFFVRAKGPRGVDGPHYIYRKLANELRIFRRAYRNFPRAEYHNYLARLHVNPNYRPTDIDAVGRLLYVYAALRLGGRQRHKNAMYMFVVAPIIKQKRVVAKIIPSNRYQVFAPRHFTVRNGGIKKITMAGDVPSFKVKGIEFRREVRPSYDMYFGDGVVVKNMVDKMMPVECFDVRTEGKFTFQYKTEVDKSKISIHMTAETFFYTDRQTKRVVGVWVVGGARGSVSTTERVGGAAIQWGSNMAAVSANELNVNLTTTGDTKIHIVHGESKAEVQQRIGFLRDHGVSYMGISGGAEAEILTTAHRSRYISGSNLRKGYLAVSKFVPSLSLPTMVFVIKNINDFYEMVERVSGFEIGIRMNVIVVYSGQNDEVRGMLESWNVASLLDRGLLVFMVDKITAPNEVVYYLCRMAEAGGQKMSVIKKEPFATRTGVIVSKQVAGQKMSVFVQSKLNKAVSATVVVPVNLGESVVSRKGAKLKVTSQKTGRGYTLRLPIGVRVMSPSTEIFTDDVQTDVLALVMDVNLKAFGEKIFDVTKMAKDVVS
ncbi:MAG: hypothetical protein FWE38_04435 [Firmicutes bacterium]|nr:hypothetical protein [Bacillota bacterium]